MYYVPYGYPYPYYVNMPAYGHGLQPMYTPIPGEAWPAERLQQPRQKIQLRDYGPDPFVVDIDTAVEQNKTFRTALWTGDHLQVTVMNIRPGEDIGLEMHPQIDQFLRIEEGQGIVRMGSKMNQLTIERNVNENYAIMVPAGTWHNVINTGNTPLKLYSIYAPPQHPFGTVDMTKADDIRGGK